MHIRPNNKNDVFLVPARPLFVTIYYSEEEKKPPKKQKNEVVMYILFK